MRLPLECEGLHVRRMTGWWTFRRPCMGRPVRRQFLRNEWLDVTAIVPATAYHRRSYAERYSRSMDVIALWTAGPAYLATFQDTLEDEELNPYQVGQSHPPYEVRANALIDASKRLGWEDAAQGLIKQVAQFLAVCSSSRLAEALCLSSPFSGQPRQKRRVSKKRTSLLIDQLKPYTNYDKLSEGPLFFLSASLGKREE
jgi:hypothetical protein